MVGAREPTLFPGTSPAELSSCHDRITWDRQQGLCDRIRSAVEENAFQLESSGYPKFGYHSRFPLQGGGAPRRDTNIYHW